MALVICLSYTEGCCASCNVAPADSGFLEDKSYWSHFPAPDQEPDTGNIVVDAWREGQMDGYMESSR